MELNPKMIIQKLKKAGISGAPGIFRGPDGLRRREEQSPQKDTDWKERTAYLQKGGADPPGHR